MTTNPSAAVLIIVVVATLLAQQARPVDIDIPDDITFDSVLGPEINELTSSEVSSGGAADIPPPSVGLVSAPLRQAIPNVLVRAVAVIRGVHTVGIVRFSQIGSGPTHISGIIKGLYPLGRHGVHVHEFRATGGDCDSAGEHYNPTGQTHGAPDSPMSHVGDLGNIQANAKGLATFETTSLRISLTGKFSVIERSLVVHHNTDDLGAGWNEESRKSGNSGGRLACGTIKFVNMIKK